MKSLHKHSGLAGVATDESNIAQIWGRIFQYLGLIVIFWLAFQWQAERKDMMPVAMDFLANLFVLGFFVVQTTALTWLVNDKTRYLSHNWMNLVIIVVTLSLFADYPPLIAILKNLRPVVIIWLLLPWIDACRRSLSDNRLGTTLLTAIFIMFLAGIVIAGIDPNIPTPAEGIYWAWVTMSTVGYGDVVPVSNIGRVFASLLILMGLGLFSVITANFSAIFVQREVKEEVGEVRKESAEIKLILENLQAMRHDEDEIVSSMSKMQKRLDAMEEDLDKMQKRE